jgi:hypothetical protein
MKDSKSRSIHDPMGRPRPFTGPFVIRARVSRRRLIVDVDDGRTLIVPLSHLPGFDQLPPRAFKNLEIVGVGIGIHFPEIDEYVNVQNLFLPPDQLRYSKILPKLIDRRPRPVHTPSGWGRKV